MAVETVSAADERDRAQAGSFGLCSVSLQVNPKASAGDLMDATECLFAAAMGVLDDLTDDVQDSTAFWGMVYMMRMARSAFVNAHDRVHPELQELRRFRAMVEGSRP